MRRRTQLILGAIAAAGSYPALRGRLRRYEIAERSMWPTLDAGDFVIAVRVERLTRGMIVIFDHPDLPQLELVKRVVALPGERVVISGGHLNVNGELLPEPWAHGPTLPEAEWRLGLGEVFVLGDNRVASASDSRSIGPIPAEAVRWRVAGRYWPPRSAGRVSQPV